MFRIRIENVPVVGDPVRLWSLETGDRAYIEKSRKQLLRNPQVKWVSEVEEI